MDLQTQYRTFSEIRDYMLQQARQRADVYVGNVCHLAKKVSSGTTRINNNVSTTTDATGPVPMDVSNLAKLIEIGLDVPQESGNFSKDESAGTGTGQECEHDLERDGDELFAVKGKGKRGGGSFQGTCFNCGMRGHEADRCLYKMRRWWQGAFGDRKGWLQ